MALIAGGLVPDGSRPKSVDFGTQSHHKFKDAKLRVFSTAGSEWNRGFWHTRFGRGQNLFWHVHSLLPVILSELDNVANPRHFPDEDFWLTSV